MYYRIGKIYYRIGWWKWVSNSTGKTLNISNYEISFFTKCGVFVGKLH
jgi:hypothetical protein